MRLDRVLLSSDVRSGAERSPKYSIGRPTLRCSFITCTCRVGACPFKCLILLNYESVLCVCVALLCLCDIEKYACLSSLSPSVAPQRQLAEAQGLCDIRAHALTVICVAVKPIYTLTSYFPPSHSATCDPISPGKVQGTRSLLLRLPIFSSAFRTFSAVSSCSDQTGSHVVGELAEQASGSMRLSGRTSRGAVTVEWGSAYPATGHSLHFVSKYCTIQDNNCICSA